MYDDSHKKWRQRVCLTKISIKQVWVGMSRYFQFQVRQKYFHPNIIFHHLKISKYSQKFWENFSFACDFEAPLLVHNLLVSSICLKKAREDRNDVRDKGCTKWQRDILTFHKLQSIGHSMQIRRVYFLSIFQIMH